jgi:RNA polymerase sigma-70 factor (ECF subfamily)
MSPHSGSRASRPAVREWRVDRSLVELAQDGDRDAFADLVRSVGDRFYALAFRILRDSDAAQDAYQETMIIAWRQLPALRDPDRFEAWARRILVHQCYAETRRRSRWSVAGSVDPLTEPLAPDAAPSVADRDELERAFRALSVDHRAVFVLHHHVGLPLIEIARTLEIPEGTARSRLHYAVRALRRSIESGAVVAPEAVA